MMNPFYWLEIRIRAAEKRLWIIALFFLVSVLLIGGGVLAIAVADSSSGIVPGEIGLGITYALLFWHGAIVVVLAPLASAGRISQEREQRTLAALVNTSVNPWKIVWGKLAAAWTFILWLSSLVLPFLAIGALWGGVPVWKLLAFLAINITVGMVISSIALGFSGVMGRSLTSYLVAGSFMLAWILVLPLLGTIAMNLAQAVDAWEQTEKVLMYIFFFNNPFFPTILIAADGMEQTALEVAAQLCYCFGVWFVLALGGVFMARRGIRREVY